MRRAPGFPAPFLMVATGSGFGTVEGVDIEWVVSLSVAGVIVLAVAVLLLGRARKRPSGESDSPDVELYLSPLTGEPLAGSTQKNAYGGKKQAAVAPRQDRAVGVEGGTRLRAEQMETVPVRVPQIGRRQLGAGEENRLLHEAWRQRNVEALRAHARATVPSSDAAAVLVASLAVDAGRVDALELLLAAHELVADKDQVEYLQDFEGQLLFKYDFPRWGLQGAVRDPILGVAVTGAAQLCARGEVGDVTQAYWMVNALRSGALVDVVKLVLFAEMEWWQEVTEFDVRLLKGTPFYGVGCFVAGVGAAKRDDVRNAFLWFGRAVECLESDSVMGGAALRHRVLVERALLHSSQGATDAAWEDLLLVSGEDPRYPGLRELLKKV